jgi:AcrR family transcriptional regulator
MPATAEDTRRKLLAAAAQEFANYGIAGARVERITRSAGVNNALLYRYFGNKLELFDRVFADLVASTVDEVPLDGADLPGYAGRLFDYYADHEDVVRLAAWRELERADSEVPSTIAESHAAKVAQVAQAQADGHVTSELDPEEILDLIVLLSLSGTPLTARLATPPDRERRRRTVVTAAKAIATGPSAD